MNFKEERNLLKHMNENLQRQIEEKEIELKQMKKRWLECQLYIEETHQQLEYAIWYEMRQRYYVERIEEPERSISPVPPNIL